jgi:hypothetical protein
MPKITLIFIENSRSPSIFHQEVRINLFRFPQYSQSILKQYMRKRAIVLPDSVLVKGKRV